MWVSSSLVESTLADAGAAVLNGLGLTAETLGRDVLNLKVVGGLSATALVVGSVSWESFILTVANRQVRR